MRDAKLEAKGFGSMLAPLDPGEAHVEHGELKKLASHGVPCVYLFQAHISSLIKSKFTSYKDFDTMMYTCAAEFDFMEVEVSQTHHCPTCLHSSKGLKPSVRSMSSC